MTLKELKLYLELNDLEFSYNNKDYFICPMNGVYSAGQAWMSESKYNNFDNLVNDFLIEGKPLKLILKNIEY